ncbi:hypothetical protein P9112_011059 [Eukaryota sp. TZLM1-RC]
MEVEESLRRITSHPGVSGVLIINQDGIPIKTWKLDSEKAVHFASVFSPFVQKAQSLLTSCPVDKESSDDQQLNLIRLRTDKNEIIITPDVSTGYVMITLQDW